MNEWKYSDRDDATLVTLTLAGDHSAYEMLVRRHERGVLAVARRITCGDGYMAEDAAQEAFVAAFVKLDRLRDGASFGAWVRRIARNCAVDMITRFRQYVSYDELENAIRDGEYDVADVPDTDEFETVVRLHESMSRLPERVGTIIKLHYFEGLSVVEIAQRLGIAEGTVKWQLHDGRARLRKEMGVMDQKTQKEQKTLVARVMEQVEQLKLWRFKQDKTGFGEHYERVLRAVEELPESCERSHAEADVLMLGWWWLPGEKNDALLARIKQAALESKNEEVMEFVVGEEDGKIWKDRIAWMRDTQIPYLEEHGFRLALGRELFWLGYEYWDEGQSESCLACLARVREVLRPTDVYYANSLSAERAIRFALDRQAAGVLDGRYIGNAVAEQYRIIDGELRFWSQPGFEVGHLYGWERLPDYIWYLASCCEGRMLLPDAKVGDRLEADGASLSLVADGVSVETPCGRFEHCQHWRTTTAKGAVCDTFYAEGVGIVRQDSLLSEGYRAVRVLTDYEIRGGKGFLPIAVGNRWQYTGDYDERYARKRLCYEIVGADEQAVTLSEYFETERLGYDPCSFTDAALQMRAEYIIQREGKQLLSDVSEAVDRCESLARSPYERAHAKAACEVMRRIFDTDKESNPTRTHSGHWNFFDLHILEWQHGKLILQRTDRRYSFEWKAMGGTGDAGAPLLYNDVLGVLQDNAECIWSDEWRDGYERTLEHRRYGIALTTKLSCREIGTVTTAAGSFDGCLELSIDTHGQISPGLSYRMGRREYVFAPDVGIVRTVNHYKNDTLSAVYELTSYAGTGHGYLPLDEGLRRRYEAQSLTDGYIASVDYAVERNENGRLCLIENQCGIRALT